MPDKDAKTCWEYFECKIESRENCPAYKPARQWFGFPYRQSHKSDKECWHVAAQYCGRVSDKRGIEKCFFCEWYKLKHPHINH
ncbi:MAG: hypothetical protein Q8L26_00240 [Candidatus Omnitrophota bacterium]|nr:hypothetical protein [Candidatus Omnitrophota bacterium]